MKRAPKPTDRLKKDCETAANHTCNEARNNFRIFVSFSSPIKARDKDLSRICEVYVCVRSVSRTTLLATHIWVEEFVPARRDEV